MPSSTSTTPRSPRSIRKRAVRSPRARPNPLKVAAPGSRSCSRTAIGLASVRSAVAGAGEPSSRTLSPTMTSVAGRGSVTTSRRRSGGTSSPVPRYREDTSPTAPLPVAMTLASSENRTPRRCSIASAARMSRSPVPAASYAPSEIPTAIRSATPAAPLRKELERRQDRVELLLRRTRGHGHSVLGRVDLVRDHEDPVAVLDDELHRERHAVRDLDRGATVNGRVLDHLAHRAALRGVVLPRRLRS